jgi:hypothetical protein
MKSGMGDEPQRRGGPKADAQLGFDQTDSESQSEKKLDDANVANKMLIEKARVGNRSTLAWVPATGLLRFPQTGCGLKRRVVRSAVAGLSGRGIRLALVGFETLGVERRGKNSRRLAPGPELHNASAFDDDDVEIVYFYDLVLHGVISPLMHCKHQSEGPRHRCGQSRLPWA